MTKPKIELRAIQQFERMSEETNCYSAKLYVDGELWGEVSNHGTGGPDNFHGAKGRGWGDLTALNERIAATHEKRDLGDGIIVTVDLEMICGDIVSEFLTERLLKRLLRTKVVFFKAAPTANGAALFEIPIKGRDVATITKAILGREPGAVVLNALPLAEALPLFAKAA